MKLLRITVVLSFVLPALSACSAAGTGTLRLFASGEEAAEVGYPTSTGPDAIAFSDGWTLTFDHVLVSVGEVVLGDIRVASDIMIVDLHEGRTELFTEEGLVPQRYDVGYSLVVPTVAASNVGPVDPAARAAMMAAGAAVYLEGTANHPTHGEYTFEIAVPGGVIASECERADGTLGIVVPESGIADGEITIHLDHFFFDSATAEEPNLRFEAWAASAGADRRITLATLATQDLADLVGVDGMPLDDDATLVAYEPPATGLPSMDLSAFVIAQALTLPHWTGEGHCNYAGLRERR